MRILLDECVPAQVAKLLAGHECRTAGEVGWSGIQNGKLLALAQSEFECFITSDQNMAYQQNLKNFDIAIIQLSTNNLRTIEKAIDIIADAIPQAMRGQLVKLNLS